ncbi:M23 family metallopeptidase [Pseudoalteromonas mariniglutinosa]|uniref:M23 family metallopeptidase n=1 Tax=Pseudoalteromonas mariniglutinosa TaxID=206042 RepID=UPI00384B8C19
MLVLIKSFYHRFFPARQLLIRQNGEVKHMVLAPWFQVSLILITLTALAWLTWSTFRMLAQSQQINDIEQHQLTKQQRWQQQNQQQQTRYTEQLEQLAALEQKHALLQSVIESLPESMSKPLPSNDENETLPVQEHSSELHAPLTDEQQSDLGLQTPDRFKRLHAHYQHSFEHIEQQINQRHQTIVTVLKGAGLEDTLTVNDTDLVAGTAQGGPLDLFDESKIPSYFLGVADKLLVLNSLENLLSELPQTLPAADYYISSSYGLRKDPMNGRRAFHKGVDLAGWHKTAIFAPADGTVLRAGRNGGYGNFIELQHKNGFVTRFGHLNKIKVKNGQRVSKDDVIGLMGSTGRSTSTHLHYEVLVNGKHVNPVKITKALSRVR